MSVGDRMYMCLVVPNCEIYDVLELTIRTVLDTWAVGVDTHTKQAYLFDYNMIGSYVFASHGEAQKALLEFRAKTEIEVKDEVISA